MNNGMPNGSHIKPCLTGGSMQNLYDNTTIGSDKFFQRLREFGAQATKAISYPPYNIKKTGDDTYVIEMAVAGFGKSDIEITLEDNILKIFGSVNGNEEPEENYIFRGIAERPFRRIFTLEDTVEIKNAELMNGMLRIWLDNFVKKKKTKKVEITDPSTKTQPDEGEYGYLSE